MIEDECKSKIEDESRSSDQRVQIVDAVENAEHAQYEQNDGTYSAPQAATQHNAMIQPRIGSIRPSN